MNKYVSPVAQQIEVDVVDILLSSCELDFGSENWDQVEGQSAVNFYSNTP